MKAAVHENFWNVKEGNASRLEEIWTELYPRIREDMGYSEEKDREAAFLLSRCSPPGRVVAQLWHSIAETIRGKTVVVVGRGPTVPERELPLFFSFITRLNSFHLNCFPSSAFVPPQAYSSTTCRIESKNESGKTEGRKEKRKNSHYEKPSKNSSGETKEPIIIAADGAARTVLRAGFVPHIITTDLDGDMNYLREAARRGSLMVVHAHGDNKEKIERLFSPAKNTFSPAAPFPRWVGTSQAAAPPKPLICPGGFTDGDRAVWLAVRFGAMCVYTFGFDFDHPSAPQYPCADVGTYLDTKKKKLAWAEHLINRAAPVVERGGGGFLSKWEKRQGGNSSPSEPPCGKVSVLPASR